MGPETIKQSLNHYLTWVFKQLLVGYVAKSLANSSVSYKIKHNLTGLKGWV